jgi:serine/threonine-protein kinase
VTYELLTGRTPYRFDSLADLTEKQREGPPAPMAGVPTELQATVLQTLRLDPEERPPSAAAYAHELARASSDTPTEAVPAPALTEETRVLAPTRRRDVSISRPAQVAVFASLGLVALLGGLWFGMSRGDDSTPPPAQPSPARADVLPRGDTPEESARLLADWLRARAG